MTFRRSTSAEKKIREGIVPQTASQWLQSWYAENCNGNWEHSQGVNIQTLDNPGWSVVIDLRGTALEARDMPAHTYENDEHDWIFCKVEDGRFLAQGDPVQAGEYY